MSKIGEAWKEIREQRSRRGKVYRHRSAQLLQDASQHALKHGLRLQMFNGHFQYNLSKGDEWTIQFYPGNRRVYSPKNKRGPYLRMKRFDVVGFVEAAVEAIGGNNG